MAFDTNRKRGEQLLQTITPRAAEIRTLVWTMALAVGLSVTAASAADVLAAQIQSVSSVQSSFSSDVASQVQAWMAIAYDRAPALVLVLGALFVMPMTALLAYSAISVREALPRAPLRSWRGPSTSLTSRPSRQAPVTAAAWPMIACFNMADGRKFDLPSKSGLVRLGRHEDNDIQLTEASVHRHHAIVHRTAEGTYMITDLSGGTGNGVAVNGERVAQGQLEHGAVVDLGAARLTFESVLV
jgi:hypothetical protein